MDIQAHKPNSREGLVGVDMGMAFGLAAVLWAWVAAVSFAMGQPMAELWVFLSGFNAILWVARRRSLAISHSRGNRPTAAPGRSSAPS